MSIFKAYDIRGIYGQDLDEGTFYLIARAYAQFCGFTGRAKVVVARDCRKSSDGLFRGFRVGEDEKSQKKFQKQAQNLLK